MVEEKKGLMEQMDALVREHLPEKVGATLREELIRLEKVEEELEAEKRKNVSLETEINKLRNLRLYKTTLDDRSKELETQADGLQKRKAEMEKAQAVLDAVSQERVGRLADMKELVHSVFSNNKFKYRREGFQDVVVPGHTDPYGSTSQPTTQLADYNETVEGEGDVPSIGSPPSPTVAGHSADQPRD